MAKGKMVFEIEGEKLIFEDKGNKFHAGGDVETIGERLSYSNANGQTCNAGDVLYTEGAIGTGNFLEITAVNNDTLNGSGILSVNITYQSYAPSGTITLYTIVILNSIPFTYTIQLS